MKLVLKPLSPRQGPQWVVQGVRAFGRHPLGLTGLFGTFLFLALLMLMVPLIGGLMVLCAIPLLGLVMMMGTAAAVRSQVVSPGLYLAPFRTDATRRRRLLALCVAYGLCSLLIVLLAEHLDGGKLESLQQTMAAGKDDEDSRQRLRELMSDPELVAGLYARLGLTLALSIPFWHAPGLVWWGQQGVAQALFSSTLAIWRGIGAFSAYLATWVGLMVAIAVLVALLLQVLGLSSLIGVMALPLGMTLSVVFYASLYFMFVQSFGTGQSGESRTDEDAPDEDLNPPA